jgi:hypothetical protein
MNTQEMTSEQQLKQVEILLATAAKTINRTTEQCDRNALATEHNTQSIELLSERVYMVADRVSEISEMFIQSVSIISQMQTEIRGLQVENQRILEQMFGDK